MLNLGIIGSDNSHALAFSKLANQQNVGNARVTMLWGEDPERTRQVAQEGEIPTIVAHPKEMLGQVDAVMVVLRHGGLHFQQALPFLKAGVPTWVDKPFTIDLGQAQTLVDTAKKHGTLLAGGSTCKYAPDVLAIKEEFQRLRQESTVFSAAFNFPGDLKSPYGGMFFYGGHAVEMLLTMFGTKIRSFRTDVTAGTMIVLAKYDDFTVTINLSDVATFYGSIFSLEKVYHREIDISSVYQEGFTRFVEAVRRNVPPEPYESLITPVKLLNALFQSMNSGQEVFIS